MEEEDEGGASKEAAQPPSSSASSKLAAKLPTAADAPHHRNQHRPLTHRTPPISLTGSGHSWRQ